MDFIKTQKFRYHPTRKLYLHFVYKTCTRCIQLVYTKCMPHFDKLLYTFCILKSKELFQLNFVYKMYTKVCQNVGYILHAFFMHQFWSTKSVHHKHYVYILYTKFIQNVPTNNCMQNGFFIYHCKQLRLETCWLIMGGTYQMNGLLDYILH